MIPLASEKFDDWRAARAAAGSMLVALDFDGTLAPIVERPEDAAALPAATVALERLIKRQDSTVAVVSGRALADVRERLGLRGVYYAGNHGMEIDGPGLERVHPEAARARPAIAECLADVRRALERIDGVLVEDKGLTASIHYRLVSDDRDRRRVPEIVRECCGGRPGLLLTSGKDIVEIRPDVPWDKGHATRFLLDAIADQVEGPAQRDGRRTERDERRTERDERRTARVEDRVHEGERRLDRVERGADRVERGADAAMPAIFVGDDRTDEDAFRALDGRGDGVVVAPEPPADTAATAYVRSPAEVAELLAALAAPG